MKVQSRIPAISLVKFKKPTKRSVLRAQADARRIHFIQRFRERVGYTLTRERFDELLCLVSLTGRFMYKRVNETGSVYNVIWDGHVLKVVYDPFTQSLITVLSPPNK